MSSPSRIVLCVPAFPKLSETFIVSKLVRLLERGWDVHVVCNGSQPSEWRGFPELERDPPMRRRVHVSPPPRPRWLVPARGARAVLRCLLENPRGIIRYVRRGWALRGWQVARLFYQDAAILALRPTILHFEFGSLATGRMYLKELLDCRVVVSFRGYDLNFVGLDRPGFYDEVWKGADAVHFLGSDLLRRAARRGYRSERKYFLIPPAVDLGFFSPDGEKQAAADPGDRPLRILSVGRLSWKKGYEHAIRAIRLLVDRGVRCEYRIVGGGEFLSALRFAIYQCDLESVVHLVGPQAPAAIRSHLLWADVFFHAAVSEGFCNAVIEAQAMEVPVVATDADGLSENVAEGETGFIVPRRDPEALADRLARLAADPGLRRRMGRAGRRRALRRFAVKEQLDAFEELYRSMH